MLALKNTQERVSGVGACINHNLIMLGQVNVQSSDWGVWGLVSKGWVEDGSIQVNLDRVVSYHRSLGCLEIEAKSFAK